MSTKGMTEVSINETHQNYAALSRAIRRGDSSMAITLGKTLLNQDGRELWSFLKLSASTDISYTELRAVVAVHALFDNWTLTRNPAFAVHAILALCETPKGTSAADKL